MLAIFCDVPCGSVFALQIELFTAPIIGTSDDFIFGANRNGGHFVRLIVYRGNKIAIFADRIRSLVILWKKDGAKVLQRQTPSFARSIGLTKSQP